MKKQLLLLILGSVSTFGFAQTPNMVANINKEGLSSNPYGMTAFKEKIYFRADSGDGAELHEFDNSQSAGNKVTQVDDIRSGTNGSSPTNFYVFNDLLYFSAYDGSGTQIFKYDGVNDPEIVINNVSNPSSFIGYKDKLYYGTGGVLNSYDATDGVQTQTINAAGGVRPDYLTVYNDTLYFTASDGENSGRPAIWKYDGENTPTEIPNTFGTSSNNSDNATNLVVFNNKLYFSYKESTVAGAELYTYDGTSVSLVADIMTGSSGSYPNQLTTFNNKLYFSARTSASYAELMEYDGVNAPTMLKDIYVGNTGSAPLHLKEFNNKLYFSADDGINGRELWVYNGTTTSLAADINENAGSEAHSLVVLDNALYFAANNGIITEKGALEIIDALGNPVLSTESTGKVDVSSLESGIYFVTQNSKRTKLIIE